MNADDFLNFKDFPPVHGSSSINNDQPAAQISINSPQKKSFGNSNDLDDLINDMSNSVLVLGDEDKMKSDLNQQIPSISPNDDIKAAQKSSSPLNIEFYQKFFNVDTFMVTERIFSSMIPKKAPTNYLKTNIGQNPDLYGPFWISVTLIFTIAISGNISNYLQNYDDSYRWHYNFHLVSYAATAIFLYAFFVPGAVWGLFKWSVKPNDNDLEAETAEYTPSLLSLMCVYGYSMAIYVPVSILLAIQYSLLQWILVIVAAFLSGSVLLLVLTPALRNSKYSLFLMIGILSAHFLLAAGLMLYFFHVPSGGAIVSHTPMKLVQETPVAVLNRTVEKL